MLGRYFTGREPKRYKSGDINFVCVDSSFSFFPAIPKERTGRSACEFDVDLSQAL